MVQATSGGRFPEGGALDRLDKALSRPIFHLALPLPLECALTVPGAWFGCPLYSLGVVPLVAAACMPEESASVKAVLAPIILAAAAFWGKLCRDSLAEVSPSIARAYTFIGKRFLIFMPNMVMAILTFSGSVVGAKVASHYMTSWFFSQLLIEVFKGLAWRLRPVACMQDELDKIPRKLKELTAIVRQPAQANLSFPSGDAAGGAVFATAVTLAAPDLRGPAVAAAALCAIGRVYFHCHHVLDVLAGQAIAVAVSLLLLRCVEEPSWRHVFLAELVLLSLWGKVQELKPRGGAKQHLQSWAPNQGLPGAQTASS